MYIIVVINVQKARFDEEKALGIAPRAWVCFLNRITRLFRCSAPVALVISEPSVRCIGSYVSADVTSGVAIIGVSVGDGANVSASL